MTTSTLWKSYRRRPFSRRRRYVCLQTCFWIWTRTHKLQAYHARCVHVIPPNHLSLFQSGKTHYVREECAVEECQAPILGGPALFFPNSGQTVLHLGLHQWRRSELLAQLLTRRKMDSLIYLMLELRSNKLEDNFEIEEETKGNRGTRRDL